MTDPALSPSELPSGARCAVHPERAARSTCSRCGNFACETCETRTPSGAVLCKACEDQGEGVIPWEERRERGFVRAFAQTAFEVVVKPWELFAARPREASILPVVLFGWLVTIPGSVLGTAVNVLTLESQRAQLLANPVTRGMVWIAEPPFQLAMGLSGVFLYPLILGLYTVMWHLPLLVFSGAKQPIKETARALGYVHAVNLPMLAVMPVIGLLNFLDLQAIGGVFALPIVIYGWVVAGIAMWKVHRCDGWRVFAAAGAQLAFLFTISCLLAIVVVFAILQTVPIPVR